MMLCRVSEQVVLVFICSQSEETGEMYEAWHEVLKSVRVNGKTIDLGSLTPAEMRKKLG